ncbi:uncharacterized protein LOC9325103 isoform X2 [Arabidopsis lyrata subsp. lyrata]|uniref:uncharacterized protein LOC9325103 isoform X2 n=1 Tax=Arabidopsis lyrata subsp. lyrata TaxID=81972 RepID=UPI000A29B0BC|nr:uncharacterized protein LOC9325103 isoform X2 [Arabidopsis lyrata subsp. lyrata]|eukprot:XP_020891403.1 uncharacterized protein LOC9325103 isoform X2 [Arabidopsis lyrata subsp. lyrata]
MEMGRRDLMRRGATNRFSNKQQSGSGFSTKSKKGMLKKLRLADEKLKQEMSYYETLPCPDLENEVSKKKSKLPKKNLKDTNGVDHASVPRKLRSAMIMKKRNLESVSKLSSVSKRLNRSKTGIESLKKDQEMEAKAIVPESMIISKDEKEVAETLYGLAGMFTDRKTCNEKETSKVDSILVVEDDYTKAESLKPVVSVLSSAKTKQIDAMPLEQSDKQFSTTGLKQSSSVNVNDAPARVNDTKVATSDKDYKSNGLALWPGLSSTTVHSGAHVLSTSSSTKLPPWMGQAVSPSNSASLLSEPLRVQPRKLKRCASHIYISRLIKVLQTSKSSPTTLNQSEQRSFEMSERRLPDSVITINDFKTMVSPAKRYQNPHLLDIHRTHNPKPVQEDMTKLALELYGPHTSQKQSFDFLSLSSAGAAQSHFPLPNSFPQYQISAAYNSQLSPATSSHQVQQLSPYLASRFQTAYNANQQQQQQLQKRLWAAQYRPTNGNTMQSNQYSKPNLSLNLTSIQQPPQVTSSPRYNNNVSQQQHRLMAAAAAMSMSHHHNNNPSRTVMNRQEHHFPLIYEDTRIPLQLLCNEQS